MAYDTAEGEDFVTVSVELVGGGPITSEVTISLATTANTAIGTCTRVVFVIKIQVLTLIKVY